MTTMTAREFNQNVAKAKRAALDGPVFVTDRGVRSHVLVSSEEYDRMARGPCADAATKPFVSALEALRPPPELQLTDEQEEDFQREMERIMAERKLSLGRSAPFE